MRHGGSKFAVTRSWSSQAPQAPTGEQFRRGAKRRRGLEMVKGSSPRCATAWAFLPPYFYMLHGPPCCSALTHHSPCNGSGPQLPPWLTDSPHYPGRELTWGDGRGRKDKGDYFLLLRELDWFTAGSGECQSLCRRRQGPPIQQTEWR